MRAVRAGYLHEHDGSVRVPGVPGGRVSGPARQLRLPAVPSGPLHDVGEVAGVRGVQSWHVHGGEREHGVRAVWAWRVSVAAWHDGLPAVRRGQLLCGRRRGVHGRSPIGRRVLSLPDGLPALFAASSASRASSRTTPACRRAWIARWERASRSEVSVFGFVAGLRSVLWSLLRTLRPLC